MSLLGIKKSIVLFSSAGAPMQASSIAMDEAFIRSAGYGLKFDTPNRIAFFFTFLDLAVSILEHERWKWRQPLECKV